MLAVGVGFQGPIAGAIAALIGLYLLLAPIGLLARKPSPVERRPLCPDEIPTWMKVFFRGLGLALIALGIALLAPVVHGG